MEWLYRTGLGAYHLGIRTAARLGHERARKWVRGRQQDVSPAIRALHAAGRPVLWLHAASLGEFEQGLPVLRALRECRPEWATVVTFFSPSGYERCHDSPEADVVAYLPVDTPAAARAWQALLRPRLAVFVKYEFWHYHLAALRRNGVPTFLVAGRFRADQPFFRSFGGWWRGMLDAFTHFCVQTDEDARLLARYGYHNTTVTGDPRVDRTAELAITPFHDERLAAFAAPGPVLFAGSVWPDDVALIQDAWPSLQSNWRLVLAPHQLREEEIEAWRAAFNADRYTGPATGRSVLILDTVGILSRAYRYGRVAYVGGGFGSGLHNTLEPLSYGLPVLFGPKHHKFPEAGEAIRRGGAFSVRTPDELTRVLEELDGPAAYAESHKAQLAYRNENRGAGRRTAEALLRLLVLLLLALPVQAQHWSQADRMLDALDGTFTKCNLMASVSGLEWRPGLCLAAAELPRNGTISLDVPLEAGRQYVFIASAESSAIDIDLFLRDPAGRVIEEDTEDDKTPVVEVAVDTSGVYSLQLHLLGGRDTTAFVSLGLLQSFGRDIRPDDYRQISQQFAAAAGAVRAAGGARRFGVQPGTWSVFGALLDDEEGTTIDNVQLPAGRSFIAATGGETLQNLDLFLANAALEIVRADDDPDPFPMIEYDNPAAAAHSVRVEVVRARGRSLVLIGLFSR
ncbi:3-deoxy-D-manno-octulosonic acid transferase [Lewinella sp. IMCC34183]|uniref:3-deoxy-D-manno-octulosonic acid transferase n=1 Tax=Lewinella sp. IMCC34183 TaxID=2248762 RepID=UPI000E26E0D0|nr:glycosyltransferase N-terminal domain-containing protein [Lewinella sp. IMCC34183]